MLTRNQLTTIILIAALLWGALLVAEGVAVSLTWLKPISFVVGALMALLSAFNLWLWRFSFFRGWLVKRPVLAGTWRASIRTTWVDPTIGTTPGPIAGFMVIRQTYADLRMRLVTAESSSVVLSADVTRAEDGLFTICGVYRNDPRMVVRAKSAIHYGAIVLAVAGDPPTSLRGHYWTDRRSAGDIALDDRLTRTFDDYGSAEKAFAAAAAANHGTESVR